jgi:hypothetical protein
MDEGVGGKCTPVVNTLFYPAVSGHSSVDPNTPFGAGAYIVHDVASLGRDCDAHLQEFDGLYTEVYVPFERHTCLS